MAEFVDVMKMARRICGSMKECDDCPIYDDHDECCKFNELAYFSDYDLSIFEEVIMQWDADHPELRYPTWQEWQQANFPNNSSPIRPCAFIRRSDAHCTDYIGKSCYDCSNQHIPAEIARKLGVQPVAKENSG